MINFVGNVAGILNVCIYVGLLVFLLWVIWLVAKPLFKKQVKSEQVKKAGLKDWFNSLIKQWEANENKRLQAEKEINDKYKVVLKEERDKAFVDAMRKKAEYQAKVEAGKRFGIPVKREEGGKVVKEDVDLMNDLLDGEKVSKKEGIKDILKDYDEVK